MSAKVLPQEKLHHLLKTFKDEYAHTYHLKDLGYFGSYARNQAKDNSDVDVVFTSDRPDLFLTAMLKQDLETLLNRRVDVIRLRENMNPRLKARIQREAIYV